MYKKLTFSLLSSILLVGTVCASNFSAVADMDDADFRKNRNALSATVSNGMTIKRDLSGIDMGGSYTICRGFSVSSKMSNGELIDSLRRLGSVNNLFAGDLLTDEDFAEREVARKARVAPTITMDTDMRALVSNFMKDGGF